MSDDSSPPSLLGRLRKNSDEFSLSVEQPQNLSWQEITERLMAFMLTEERMGMAMAFGEGEDKDKGPEGIRHLDPIQEFQKVESRLDEIESFVAFVLQHREKTLLEEASHH